jgi:hypothetical protein
MANKPYQPLPTPKRLHRERLERERNAPPRENPIRVPWQVNAAAMLRMDEDERFNDGQ